MKKISLILFAVCVFMASCEKTSECEDAQPVKQGVTIPDPIKALMETGSYQVNGMDETDTRALPEDRIITTNNYLNRNGKEYDVAYFYEDDNLRIPLVLEYDVQCNYTVWSIGILNGDPVSMNPVYTRTVTIPAGVVSYVLYSGPYTAPAPGEVDYRRYVITNSMKYVK